MRITNINIPLERFEQLFYAFDLNMDGYIDSIELNALAIHIDINGDGLLDVVEVMLSFGV